MFTPKRTQIIPSRRNIKGAWFLYAPIAITLIVTSFFIISRHLPTTEVQETELTGDLPIKAPQTITVGDSVNVTIGPVEVNDGTLVGLVMVGKHGPRVYRGIFEQGIAFFTIPGEHTMQPGHLAFIAASESARGEIGVLLRPNPRQFRSGDRGLNISFQNPPRERLSE